MAHHLSRVLFAIFCVLLVFSNACLSVVAQEQAENDVVALTQENQRLKSSLSTQAAEIRTLNEKLKAQERLVNQNAEKLTKLSAQLNTVESAGKKKEAIISGLKEQLEELKVKNIELAVELDTTKAILENNPVMFAKRHMEAARIKLTEVAGPFVAQATEVAGPFIAQATEAFNEKVKPTLVHAYATAEPVVTAQYNKIKDMYFEKVHPSVVMAYEKAAATPVGAQAIAFLNEQVYPAYDQYVATVAEFVKEYPPLAPHSARVAKFVMVAVLLIPVLILRSLFCKSCKKTKVAKPADNSARKGTAKTQQQTSQGSPAGGKKQKKHQ